MPYLLRLVTYLFIFIAPATNAALVEYRLTGDLLFDNSGFEIDAMDLDSTNFELSFTYDDAALRTNTNGSNLDAFTPTTPIKFEAFKNGSLHLTSETIAINYDVSELDSLNRYFIDFRVQNNAAGAKIRYFGGFQSTGSSASSPSNVFDPIGAPPIAESFYAQWGALDSAGNYTLDNDTYYTLGNTTLSITPVPVPAAFWLFSLALISLRACKRQ